jgi:hypothetical protein
MSKIQSILLSQHAKATVDGNDKTTEKAVWDAPQNELN